MAIVTLKDFKVPKTCGECGFIGEYTTGVYARNPHCCCEFIWQLKKIDYRVDKDSLDENCPFKLLNLGIKEEIDT